MKTLQPLPTHRLLRLAGTAISGFARRGEIPGNQADAALMREVGPRPLGHHDDAVAEADQPEDVQEDPEQPGDVAGDLQAEHVADCRAAADRRHDAVVLVAEWLQRSPGDRAADVLAGAGALLHRDLRDAG